MVGRQPIMLVSCGRRATGKTVETIKTLYSYCMGSASIKPRKVLIFDVNNEFSNFDYFGQRHEIQTLKLQDVPKFTHPSYPVEIRRILPYKDGGRRMTTDEMVNALSYILSEYRNGCLLIEDINKYVSDNTPADVIGAIARLRHQSVDTIIHYQNIGRVGNPKILGNTNVIRLHKTNDSAKRHKNKFEDKEPLISVAQKIVEARFENGMKNNINDDSGKYFHVYINLEFGNIRGKFSKKEAELAVADYIAENYQSLIKPYLHKIDMKTGKALYPTKLLAYQEVQRKMIDEFFDFN